MPNLILRPQSSGYLYYKGEVAFNYLFGSISLYPCLVAFESLFDSSIVSNILANRDDTIYLLKK